MSVPKLELRELRKEYDNGQVIAVEDIDLSIEAGETIALLGPSGCGKSTTLNLVVGLEQADAGDILIDGRSVVNTPAGKRNVGLVFQDYAVFHTMSVRKNLAFGLEIRSGQDKLSKEEINRAVEEVAELLDMGDRLDAKARELGGSELQRVAIGRTLVTKPSILLLDEPLSNLETEARLAMRRELRRLQSEIGLTIIYVTHDQIEALSLADKIAVMNYGKILQVEETALICEKPDHTFVAGFLGSPPMNLVSGQFQADEHGLVFSKDDDFTIPIENTAGCTAPEGYYTLGIRPESVKVMPENEGRLSGTVRLVEPRGMDVVLTVEIGRQKLQVIAPPYGHPDVGQSAGLYIDYNDLTFFGGDYDRRIEICLTEGGK